MAKRSFTSKDPAITINYIGFVYRTLINEGYLETDLLEHTGLAAVDLLNPDYRCTFEQHKQFAINAMTITRDPHLGLRMAARYNPINIGLPMMAALSSETFSTALEVFKEYISLNFSIIAFEYHQQGEHLIIDWHPSVNITDEAYFVLGSCMVLSEACWRFLLGWESQVTLFAELKAPEPEGWQGVESIIGFPVRFAQPVNRMVIPAKVLSQHLASNDPVLHQNMLRLCQKQKADSFYDNGLEARVRNLIAEGHYASVSCKQAAERLGMSERQLSRQLEESGTRYKKIHDDVRISRARELLAIPGLPVSTIAYDLGFCDPSNFARTFKRWTGQSPVEFRGSRGQN